MTYKILHIRVDEDDSSLGYAIVNTEAGSDKEHMRVVCVELISDGEWVVDEGHGVTGVAVGADRWAKHNLLEVAATCIEYLDGDRYVGD
jgi:hypothetical protein